MKIWCLFSIDNEYNQPDNNLIASWVEKPKVKDLCSVLGIEYEKGKSYRELGMITNGKEVRLSESDYRLESRIIKSPQESKGE